MSIFKTQKAKTIIVIAIFLAVWLWDVSFAYKYGESYLDTDMASEMILANESNQDGVYLDSNWIYSSEIRILGQVMLFKPLLLFFPNNWGLARVVAQAIFLLATGASYIYLTSVLCNFRRSVFFAAILLCPFSYWHLWHDCFDGFYLIWIIFYSLLAGVILRLAIKEKKGIGFRIAFAVLLSFVCGIQSIRVFYNILLPVILASIILLFLSYKKKKGCPDKVFIKFFVTAVSSTVVATIGYAINSLVLSQRYSYGEYNGTQWQELSFDRIFTVLENLLEVLGYPFCFPAFPVLYVFSNKGMITCFSVLMMGIFVFSFIFVIKRLKVTDSPKLLLGTLGLMAALVPVMVFSFLNVNDNGSYFLPAMGLLVALLQISFDEFNYTNQKETIIAHAALLGVAILCGLNTRTIFLQNPYRSNPAQVEMAAALKEQGYTQAIATYWNGNVVTELTDGQVEVWSSGDYDTTISHYGLQKKQHIDQMPKGRYAYIYPTFEYLNSYHTKWDDSDNACVVYQDDVYTVIGVEE